MNWTILGIGPTKDKNEITRAYRAKLSVTNPEDKPEEFKELRAAYEEALAFAKEKDVPQEEKTPVQVWIDKIRAIYDHYPSRLSPECWQKALRDNICLALDSRPAAEEALLVFLMENSRIPQQVWQVLDQEFDWLERLDELSEKYPPEFLEYSVSNGVRFGEVLTYTLFTPGQDAQACDAYVLLYLKARQAESLEEALEYAHQFTDLPESHPYGQALACRLNLAQGETEALEPLVALAQEHPFDDYVVISAAQSLYEAEEYEQGAQLCATFLEQGESDGIKHVWARCLAGMGEYAQAVERINQVMKNAGGDQVVLMDLAEERSQWNGALVEDYEQRLAQNPEDDGLRIDLAWCYLQNDRVEDSWRVAQLTNVEKADPFAYHNLAHQLHESAGRFQEALESVEALIAHLKTLEPGKDEETDKRIARIPEKSMARARVLFFLERKEEAAQAYEEALALSPEDANLLTDITRFYFSQHDFEKAGAYAIRLTKVFPGSYHGFMLQAFSAFEMNHDQEAFEAVNKAIDRNGSDITAYLVKLRILIRNGAFDAAQSLIEFLEESGAGDFAGVHFCKAMLLEFRDKDYQAAKSAYEAVADQLEEGEEEFYGQSGLFYRLAIAMNQVMDLSQEENLEKIVRVLDKGLETNSLDADCLDFKGWLLERLHRDSEAIEAFRTLRRLPFHSIDVERQLGNLLRKDLVQNAPEAYECYERLMQAEPDNAAYIFYAGNCLISMMRFDEAEALFLKEKDIEPDNVDPYRRLALVYEAQGRLQDALDCVEKCVQIAKEAEQSPAPYLARKMRICRRMNRPEQAVCTAREIQDVTGEDTGRSIFEIYLQFGMFDEAAKHLKQQGAVHGWPDFARVRLEFAKGQYLNARLSLLRLNTRMDEDDREDMAVLMEAIGCKYATEIARWKKRLSQMEQDDYDGRSWAYMNLAEACWRDGDLDAAKSYAALGVEACDKALEKHVSHKALFYGRKSMVLGILGRMDEAWECLATQRSLPLCDFCDYCTCKDADLFESVLAALGGDNEKALKLAEEGQEKWPDEEDFIVHKCFLKKGNE